MLLEQRKGREPANAEYQQVIVNDPVRSAARLLGCLPVNHQQNTGFNMEV